MAIAMLFACRRISAMCVEDSWCGCVAGWAGGWASGWAGGWVSGWTGGCAGGWASGGVGNGTFSAVFVKNVVVYDPTGAFVGSCDCECKSCVCVVCVCACEAALRCCRRLPPVAHSITMSSIWGSSFRPRHCMMFGCLCCRTKKQLSYMQ